MRRYIGSILLGMMMLSACQVPVLTNATNKPGKPDAKGSQKPSPAASNSANPSPSASTSASSAPSTAPSPSVSIAPSSAPSAPPITGIGISGLVKMDANYVISTGGGNFVSTNGGTFVATNGGTVISVGGGNFVSTNSGTVIATGGGNFVATNGGTVISVGGGNVISTGGGNVISTGGGNVISTGGGNYQLLAGAFRVQATGPAPGEILPIKGMVVVPVSLITGKPIGPPVLTDETGHYLIDVPKGTQENVLIYAGMPGKDASDIARLNDPRLRLGAIVNPLKPKETIIDEDTGQATRYALLCLVNRLRRIIESPDDSTLNELLHTAEELPLTLRVALTERLKEIKKRSLEAGFMSFSEPKKQAFMHMINDTVIANATAPSLEEILIKDAHLHYFHDNKAPLAGRSAVAVMKDLAATMRPYAEAALKNPTMLAKIQARVNTANTYRAAAYPGTEAIEIKRAADVMDFVVKAYMAENPVNEGADSYYSGQKAGSSDEAAGLVFEDMEATAVTVPDDPTGKKYDSDIILRAGAVALLEGVTVALFNDKLTQAIEKAIAEFK